MAKSEKIILKFMILTGLSSLFLFSCNPDIFYLNQYESNQFISVKMLNGIEKAEKINGNSVKINTNALISFKQVNSTQNETEFDLQLTEGNGVKIYLYTTEADFQQKPNLEIDLTKNNYTILNNNQIIAESDTLKLLPQTFHRIKFRQDANLLKFSFDCVDIWFKNLNLKSSEYIIFRTDNDSKAIIRGINRTENYQELDGNYLENNN